MVVGPDGARNEERLCWRGPAVVYWTGLQKGCGRRTFQDKF
jgi:hypothetical protein